MEGLVLPNLDSALLLLDAALDDYVDNHRACSLLLL